MNLELKIEAPQSKPVVFNYEELREGLTTALADYKNRIYTEDMIGEAKADKAKLNKLRKTLSDERIARKKDFMKPFETFENQVKELCEIIDAATSGIDEQLESYEAERIKEKHTEAKTAFDEIISNYDLDFITYDMVFDKKWLNKTVTIKAISEEITAICEKALKDLEIISKMPYSFEAKEVYKVSLDLNKALAEGERVAEIEAKKKQATAEKLEAINAPTPEVTGTIAAEPTFDVAFKCRMTRTQALALKKFCDENGIKLIKV